MDKWKYYDITHRFHTYLNPLSPGRMEELISLINLHEGAEVLDIGCGKGEFLMHLAKYRDIQGTGVESREQDLSCNWGIKITYRITVQTESTELRQVY